MKVLRFTSVKVNLGGEKAQHPQSSPQISTLSALEGSDSKLTWDWSLTVVPHLQWGSHPLALREFKKCYGLSL